MANDFTADMRRARVSGDAESIPTAGYFYVEAALDLSQVLIKLSAKIGETNVIGGFEDNVLGCLYGIQCQSYEPFSGQANGTAG